MRRRKQGSSASRAPGETESQREDSRAATSRRGTDGGPGGSGSLAEGGVTRSPPGLERGPRGLKIARGGGSALQLDLVSLPESLSLSVCLASVPPAPRWPRPSRPGLAAEGQGAPPTPGETARPPGPESARLCLLSSFLFILFQIPGFYTPLSPPNHCPPRLCWSGLAFPSQVIFPTQGLNLGLPHCRQILYHLNHQGSL